VPNFRGFTVYNLELGTENPIKEELRQKLDHLKNTKNWTDSDDKSFSHAIECVSHSRKMNLP
jgi:hypothetical protein